MINAALRHLGADAVLALAVELLADVERDLQRRGARQLEPFWHDPDPHKLRRPRRENECRNRLQAVLRPRLQTLGISLSLETQPAATPVPIWAAWADPLEGHAAHPDAGAVGVYLVLWSGQAPRKMRGAPCTPSDAQDRQVQHQALMPPADRQRLPVGVLDWSHPPRRLHRARSQKRQSA